MIIGRLGYNEELNRYGILVSDLWENEGLHCGDCIEVLINNEWTKDRIEYDNKIKKWYLFNSKLVGEELEFLKVRFNLITKEFEYTVKNNEKEFIIENEDIVEYKVDENIKYLYTNNKLI